MRGIFKRSGSWLLVSLLIAILFGVSPAWAIANGGTESGSITGTGTQDYLFYAVSGESIKVGLTEVTQDNQYYGSFTIYNPDGTAWLGAGCGTLSPGCRTGGTASQTGTFKVTAKNTFGSTYPSFNASFDVHVSVSGQPANGASLYNGQNGGGAMYGGSIDHYTFNANSSDNLTVTMTPGGSFTPNAQFDVFYPDGTSLGGSVGSPATHNFLSISQTGTYFVRAYDQSTFTGPGSYTMGVTGNTALPNEPKTAGKFCFTCTTNKLIRAVTQWVNYTGGGAVGLPINVATGNMSEVVTDYTTVGTNPLALTRYYNSYQTKYGTYATNLGPNWRHNYDRYLRVQSTSLVAAERPDGSVVNFSLVSSVWTPDTDMDIKLTGSGTSFTLTDSADVAEAYTVASGKGTLNTITAPNGYVQTLAYTGGKLSTVTDSYSRVLTFTYTGSDLTGVSTPDTATLTYGYTSTSGSDLLTSVTYNTSPTTNQTYVYGNSFYPFALTSITDENGNTNSQWTYDGAGRCTMSEHAGGADEVQVSYDDSTGNRTVTGPLGEALTYSFTSSQNMNKVSSIARAANSPVAAATENFTYDTNGFLATATDWDGNSTHWTNNSHGQPTSITEAFGAGIARTTTISYDSTWVHKPYTTTKTNVTIDDRYDATQGTLLTHKLTDTTGGTSNGQTHIWTYTYNATGEMLTAQAPRTDVTVKTIYTYTSGALASITDPIGNLTTINTANGTGQPTKITDPNSVETDLVYDHRNRLTSRTVVASPSNEVTTYTYFGSGQPDLITLPDSSTIDFDYDTAQRLTTINNTAGETINYTLNAAGKATTTTIKDSGGTTRKSSTATYDVLADMLTRVGSAGATQTTTYVYDGNQNRTKVTDANSNVWQQAYDALNRMSTVTDPLTHTAAPTYNNLDYVTAQTDFNGYSTSFTRDAFGNAFAKSSPDTGSATLVYDEDNNQTKRTDARSVVTNRTFDKLERPLTETFPSYTSENIAYTYDSTTGGNKGIGRLTSVSDESGSTARTYDNFGNITKEVRVIGAKTYTISYSYDLANRLKEIIYPSGRYVDYTYDSSGYLTTVTTKPTSVGTVTTMASSIVHKPFGPIASFTYGNSEAQTRTFDNNYWLSTLNTVNGTTYKQKLSFGEDNAGNLTSITDNSDTTRNQTFGVDALNRLHTASGKYGSRTYTYDNNSNRATKVAGATTYTYTYTTSTNLLASYTDGTSTRHFTNTATGNMATDDRTFVGGGSVVDTFGGRDRLESQTVNAQAVTFKINAFGQRVSKAFSGATTHYIHDIRGNIIAEANGSTGATTKEYVWMEDMLLAQIDSSGNIVYVHSDQVNNPQKITNPSRTTVWDQIIEPFGEVFSTPTTTTPTNHRFPGQYADAENALSYNNARDYDKSTGRYIEADPLGLGAGPNIYAYAGDNPTQNIDPLGLSGIGYNFGFNINVQKSVPTTVTNMSTGDTTSYYGGTIGGSVGPIALFNGQRGFVASEQGQFFKTTSNDTNSCPVPQTGQAAGGAALSKGVSVYYTDANSIGDLNGPSQVDEYDLGIISYQHSTSVNSSGTPINTWSFGFSLGIGHFQYETNSIAN